MTNFEKLLDITFPVVERLMEEYGEFYPIATAIKLDGDVVPVATFYGEEHPTAADLLEKLKDAFIAKKEDYRSLVICYNGNMIHPENRKKIDVIVFIAEDNDDKEYYHFYYPYKIHGNNITFDEPWKSEKLAEIFK